MGGPESGNFPLLYVVKMWVVQKSLKTPLRNIKMAPYRNLSLEQIERKKYPPPKIDHYYVKKNQKNLRRTALCNSIYYLVHTFFIFKTRI